MAFVDPSPSARDLGTGTRILRSAFMYPVFGAKLFGMGTKALGPALIDLGGASGIQAKAMGLRA